MYIYLLALYPRAVLAWVRPKAHAVWGDRARGAVSRIVSMSCLIVSMRCGVVVRVWCVEVGEDDDDCGEAGMGGVHGSRVSPVVFYMRYIYRDCYSRSQEPRVDGSSGSGSWLGVRLTPMCVCVYIYNMYKCVSG